MRRNRILFLCAKVGAVHSQVDSYSHKDHEPIRECQADVPAVVTSHPRNL